MSEVLYAARTAEGTRVEYTLERLAGLVSLLPEETLAKLALGPIDDDHPLDHADGDCRACAALTEAYEGYERRRVVNAAGVLHDWHQCWDRKEQDPNFLIGRGLESYLRSVLLYVLAGWDGEWHP